MHHICQQQFRYVQACFPFSVRTIKSIALSAQNGEGLECDDTPYSCQKNKGELSQ